VAEAAKEGAVRRMLAAGMGALLVLAAMWATVPAAAQVGDDRQTELGEMLEDSCTMCHGTDLAGGLATALTPEALAGKDPKALADAILNGIPGTMMPGFSSALTPEEAAWLAGRLQTGHKAP
jgi:cytochrome c55X